jgi:hypothetical protein
MSGAYRVTVRGIMSERFCAGFCGLSRRIEDGRTVLDGRPPMAPPLHALLSALGNLGLEVVRVEPDGTTANTTQES